MESRFTSHCEAVRGWKEPDIQLGREELGELGSEITRKNPSTQPTIKVTVGFRFDMLMTSGILLEAPWLNDRGP
jgi:hypothetical protein